MRYEIKYVYPYNYEEFLVRDVLNLPGAFREIYHERKVNNIYFDTIALDDYHASVYGASNRSKVRVRWYDNISKIKSPIIEVKYKRGMVGGKKTILLTEFSLDGKSDLPDEAEVLLANRQPSLVNSYKRRYFSNPDDSCRITIDWDIRYYSPNLEYTETYALEDKRIILEAKFEKEELSFASEILQHLNRHIGKNSKYVRGIDAVVYSRTTI